MINEIVVGLLKESNKCKQKYWEQYKKSDNAEEKRFYREAYIRAFELYSARYQMLLAFGYDVVTDKNNNIIGLKKI